MLNIIRRVGPSVVIALAAILHYFVAANAAATKSATFDEPINTLAGIMQTRFNDYRINPEHPVLWKHIAGWATFGIPFSVDLSDGTADKVFAEVTNQWEWTVSSLFRNPSNDGVRLIDQSRAIMPVFGCLVVLLVGIWAYQVAGPAAGGIAATLAAFDPTMLAHSGLVTNDVACTFSLLFTFYTSRNLLTRGSLLRISMFLLSIGFAACIKFTSLAIPMFLLPLVIVRLLDETPWMVFASISLATFFQRLLFIALVFFGAAFFAWTAIWSSYGFRYLPTNSPTASFDKDYPAALWAANVKLQESAASTESITTDEVHTSIVQRICLVGREHKLLPEAYLHGLAFAQAMSISRGSYLDGVRGAGGSAAFFPRAWLYKTPIATIIGAAACYIWCLLLILYGKKGLRKEMILLVAPSLMFFLVALTFPLNIGIRHLLPALPAMWIALGIAAAYWHQFITARVLVYGLLSFALLEALTCHPHYIAFFNLVSRGNDQGLGRLSDSNLDWGQDLRLLAEWQRENPDTELYLSYFGSADPVAYGIRYTNIEPGYLFGPDPVSLGGQGRGVVAYSATTLQGTYENDRLLYDQLQRVRTTVQPLHVIGGSIYLYDATDLYSVEEN